MYERKLNGILADEMGLGKTIQTIGLLAWLACEKGIFFYWYCVSVAQFEKNLSQEFGDHISLLYQRRLCSIGKWSSKNGVLLSKS